MLVFDRVGSAQQWCIDQKKAGKSIGLVPTMGYLHEGHLALVEQARKQCDTVVVSIFVNPIQFGAGEDFDTYPRDLSRDQALLEEKRVDALFAPSISEMYPAGYHTFVEVGGEITAKLCGASRPGHFKGVATVVSKLFNICLPDKAYFGQKDAQQAMVIEKMVRELNFPIEIVRVPIVREADGLAKSSRNVYLDAEQRKQALVLSKALAEAHSRIKQGERDVARLKEIMRAVIAASPQANIDYVEIYDAADLSDVEQVDRNVLIALAVKIGSTRLIDNLLVEV
ncbi:MAG: pantoate--beta-alanine ligase [Syntrophomonadaceae bacterium]|jgi:pantoate--beta-alanine ligase|nr:pantoate--beta-alanine ligase [Syntrophomonadaceae bacterium]